MERDHALVDGGREGGSSASTRPRSLPVHVVPCSSPHPSLLLFCPGIPRPRPSFPHLGRLLPPFSSSTRPPPDAPQPLPRTAPSSFSRPQESLLSEATVVETWLQEKEAAQAAKEGHEEPAFLVGRLACFSRRSARVVFSFSFPFRVVFASLFLRRGVSPLSRHLPSPLPHSLPLFFLRPVY